MMEMLDITLAIASVMVLGYFIVYPFVKPDN